MSSVVRSIRASAEEWQAWQAAAGDVSLNTWVRQSLNEQTQLVAALDRVTEPEPVLQVVERLQQQVPGVTTAGRAFPSVPQDLAGPVKPRPRGGP